MMNRNTSSFAKVSHLMQKQGTQERKLRTRTRIQAGGLLRLSGLLDQCDISEGEDLQYDFEGYKKAATLLGILIKASEALLQNHDTQQMEQFRKIGESKMKQTAAKYY